MRGKIAFSKLLILLESALVLYTTHQGIALARLAVEAKHTGTLPWLTAIVTAAWGAYGTSSAFYYGKAKAENTAGGIVYEMTCRRGQDCETRE